MNILILTSKDHIYANFVIKNLINSHVFDKHKIAVFEQDWVIPYKSSSKGLLRYLLVAGLRYTLAQMTKQYLFVLLRYAARMKNKRNSIFYPYYVNNLASFKKRSYKNLKSEKAFKYIERLKPDLIISIYSKEIITNQISKLPKHGSINLHPSLLPAYRGISPIFWALANGEKECGATLHYIDEGIDSGEIIFQDKIMTDNYKTEHSLYLDCAKLGVRQVKEYLGQVVGGSVVKNNIKNEEGSYYSMPTKEAVKQFLKNGYSFFHINEFLSN